MSQVASKSGQEPSASTEDVEELLDTVDKTLDRLKTLYEQYFLGIQKQAPAYIHSDLERKLRDILQLQIRNTGLRYRLTSIQAKFASYNSYWRRTLRQIENGTYVRNLSKIGRQAARNGADIPEEILAAMPKRMREQVLKDREAALAAARRHEQVGDDELLSLDDGAPALVKEATELRRQIRGAHVVQDDGDFDLDAFFKEVASGDADDKTPEDQPPVMLPPEPAPVRAAAFAPPQRASSPVLRAPTQPGIPASRTTGPIPTVPSPSATGPFPRQPTGPVPRPVGPGASGPIPVMTETGPIPRQPTGPVPTAPSQASRPNPVAPGAAAARGNVGVESMPGPFPRQPTGPVPRPPGAPRAAPPVSSAAQPPQRPAPAVRPEPGMRPPPGMTDADVNALYAKYVKAKEAVGEKVDAGSRDKLLKTINQSAPKIMEQYKASGVDFSVVVKDNQVIIKAKPKT